METFRALRIHAFGGPEEIVLEDLPLGSPGAGEVRIAQKAIAVHFADTLMRAGAYYVKPALPATLGLEAAGVVETVGPGVAGFVPGDRIAYPFLPGAAVSARNVPASALVKLPDSVDEKTAAAGLLRGMTVQYLLRRSYIVGPDDVVLVHAAAGGVGTLLCQWARHLGATVIGTVGRPAKAAVARAAGCAHVIDYTGEDFAARCLEITAGEGVSVVYDSVGQATYEGNLAALAPTGYFINYGHSSGRLPPIDAMALNAKSIFFAKVSYRDYARTPAAVAAMADETLDLIGSGVIKVGITATYPFNQAAQAHRDIAARKTTGCVVLVV